MERRRFLKASLLSAAATPLLPTAAAAAEGAAGPELPDQSGLGIRNYNPAMRYRPMGNTGVMVSALGFGMLRLKNGADGKVDFGLSTDIVRRAVDGGVNYIDSARLYLGGQSELAVGKALANGLRDRVYLTSKLPWWIMESASDFEKLFDESRKALNTDVIDFYHIHMVMHRSWKDRILPWKLVEKMEKLKAQGKIRFMGFSFHDRLQLFKTVVDAAPWDFCLVQHNYLDMEYEAGIMGPKYAASKGMGVSIMKPVRTGLLGSLPKVMQDALKSSGIEKKDAEWALDYLWDIPEVSVAVSGMNSVTDVEENLAFASRAAPGMLTPEERRALGAAIRAFRSMDGHVNCVGCYQCIPCPKNVAIGYILAYVWNNYLAHQDRKRAIADYTRSMSPIQRGDPASSCCGCGECLPKCPMGVDIPAALARVRDTLEA